MVLEHDETTLSKPKILIVDDRAENLYILRKLLSRLNVEVVQALSGLEALGLVLEADFCCAIIDIQMPEMDGYELVELLRCNHATAHLPVIFVSAIYSDEYHHSKAYERGAVDFLSKPFVPEILLSKVRVFLDLYQQRQNLAAINDRLQQTNADLQQTNQALHQTNVDKDRILTIISHDLRSPFNAILGLSQLMGMQAASLQGEELAEMASSIYSSAKTAYSLLDNLLTWARLQREKGTAPRMEPFCLGTLIDETLEVHRQAAAAKGITITNEVQDVELVADRRMVATIVRNLTGNAVKFTPNGGTITVITAPGAATNAVIIGVRDTGIGMSAETQAKLFRPDVHHSTPGTAQEPGSGLGLLICREMAERSGGRIWVESEEGKGATFWFTIPVIEPAKITTS